MNSPDRPAAGEPAGRTVVCPACRGPSRYGPTNPWRPFCSEHCRQLDLGAWASERYRVATQAPEDPDTEGPGATH